MPRLRIRVLALCCLACGVLAPLSAFAGPRKLLESQVPEKQLLGIAKIEQLDSRCCSSREANRKRKGPWVPRLVDLVGSPAAEVRSRSLGALVAMEMGEGTYSVSGAKFAVSQEETCALFVENVVAHWSGYDSALSTPVVPLLLNQECADVGPWLQTHIEDPSHLEDAVLAARGPRSFTRVYQSAPEAVFVSLPEDTRLFANGIYLLLMLDHELMRREKEAVESLEASAAAGKRAANAMLLGMASSRSFREREKHLAAGEAAARRYKEELEAFGQRLPPHGSTLGPLYVRAVALLGSIEDAELGALAASRVGRWRFSCGVAFDLSLGILVPLGIQEIEIQAAEDHLWRELRKWLGQRDERGSFADLLHHWAAENEFEYSIQGAPCLDKLQVAPGDPWDNLVEQCGPFKPVLSPPDHGNSEAAMKAL